MRLIIRNIIITTFVFLISMNVCEVIAGEHYSGKMQKRENHREGKDSSRSWNMHKDENRNVKTEKVQEFFKREKKEKKSWKNSEKMTEIFNRSEPLMEQTQDFGITIEIKGIKRDDVSLPRLNNIHQIRVRRLDNADPEEKYRVIYYLDNIPRQVFSDVSLPFRFKRTFRGVAGGIHIIGLHVVDEDHKRGIDTYRVEVRH